MSRIVQALRDSRGAAAIEFALIAPIFIALVLGIMAVGMLLLTQFSLQHGAEMAARCASINKNTCGTTSAIQTYAAQQTFGLNPPPSTFSVSTEACGNRITASYTFLFLTTLFGVPSVTLTAQSCFPS